LLDLSLTTLLGDLKEVGYAVLVGSLINVVLTLLWALRWRAGLKYLGVRASYLQSLIAIVASFPLGNLLPAGKVVQEAFRIAYLDVKEGKRTSVMAAAAVEWVAEGLIISFLLLAVIIRHYALGAVALTLVAVAAGQPQGMTVKSAARDLIKALRLLSRDRRLMSIYLAVSSVIIAIDVIKVWLVALMSGLYLALFDLMLLYVILRVTSAAPTPAALGFLDLGVIGALKYMGYPVGLAVLFLVSLRLVDTVIPSIAGMIALAVTGSYRMLRQARGAGSWRR
jgi:uncharacterized membrane protein YbhN (UPF0104 family)